MDRYCVNKNAQEGGEHEVHKDSCSYLPDPENQEDLGYFSSCHGAVQEAKEKYPTADGCKHCCPDCHRR